MLFAFNVCTSMVRMWIVTPQIVMKISSTLLAPRMFWFNKSSKLYSLKCGRLGCTSWGLIRNLENVYIYIFCFFFSFFFLA